MTAGYADYERLVRAYCEFADSDSPLDLATPMVDLGINSSQVILLVVDLEEAFDIEFPIEFITAEVFETPGTLWATVQAIESLAD